MRATFCSFAFGLFATLTTASAQQLPLDVLPPSSSAIIGINLSALRSSAVGQSIMAELRDNKTLPVKVKDMLNGIDEILISRPAGRNQRQNGLAVMRMGCRDDHLDLLLNGQQATVSSFNGTRVLTMQREGQPFSLACVNSGTVAAGDPESLKWALGRRPPGRTLSASLATTAQALRAANDIWVVANANMAELASELPQEQSAALAKAPLVQSIRQISGGAKLGTGITIAMNITAKTAQDAEMLAGSLMMFAGMMKSNPKQAKQFGPLLDHLNVAAHGDTMEMSLHLTEQQLAMIAAQMKASGRTGATGIDVNVLGGAAPTAQPPSGDIKIYSSDKDMGIVTLPAPK